MNRLTALLRLFAVSAISGIVAAGLFLPAAGSTMVAADEGIALFDDLPSELEAQPLAQPSRLLTRDGEEFATFYWQNRQEVGLDAISQAMRDATLAIEDHRFYEHGAVDLEGIARAAVKNLLTGSLHGGSTLTQQYVKNVLIVESQARGDEEGIDDARDRSGVSGLARKLREMRLAMAVEKAHSKDEILQRYLNIASYSGSPNVYGVQAAARQYWGVDAAELTIAQAATLAGIVRNPDSFNPQKHPEAVIERRNLVLDKMAEYGYITAGEQATAQASGLDLEPEATPNGCAAAGDLAYFCSFVEREVLIDDRFGSTREDRETALRRGGLTIRTSIDPPLQGRAVESVRARLPVGDPSGAAQSLVSVDVASGEVRVMTQNTDFAVGEADEDGSTEDGNAVTRATSVNYAVDADFGGGTGFQPGSTWKPFVLAAWLDDGRSLGDQVNGSGSNYTGFSTRGCDPRDYASAGYNPRNAGDSGDAAGEMTVLDATKKSVNKAYADMASQLNMCDIRDVASGLGVHLGTGEDLSAATVADGTEQVLYPSSILGTVSVSPLTMASAYTAFANHGIRCAPHGIVEVTDSAGEEIPAGEEVKACAEAIDPKIADTVAYALTQTFNGGTTSSLRIGTPAGAKTGTTNFEVGASWVVGFTRGLSTAVWMGDPAGMRDWRTNGRGRMPRIVYGQTVSGPTWQEFMDFAGPRETAGGFPRPAGATVGRPEVIDVGPDSERSGTTRSNDAADRADDGRRAGLGGGGETMGTQGDR